MRLWCLPVIRSSERLGNLQRTCNSMHGHCDCAEQQLRWHQSDHRTVDLDPWRERRRVSDWQLRLRCVQFCDCGFGSRYEGQLWQDESGRGEGRAREAENMAVVNADEVMLPTVQPRYHEVRVSYFSEKS